jgi:uncharacterized protein (TIGR03083 family)
VELRLDTTKAVLQIRGDGPALSAAAGRAGLEATVPPCPGWTARDLVGHVGSVYHRAAAVVRDGLREPAPSVQPPAEDLIAWYDAAHADLVTALRTSDLTREVYAFVGPQPASWWARRIAHETVVHRADAELAAGAAPPRVDAVVAVDGIDEVLTLFLSRAPASALSGQSVAVHTPDERWHVTLSPEGAVVQRGSDAPADGLVAGTPSHVLYHLWGRLPADEVDERGDATARAALRTALRQATGG